MAFLVLAGCGNDTQTPATNTPTESDGIAADGQEKTNVNFAVLSGPIGIGTAKLLSDNENENVLSVIPKANYIYNTLPVQMKNFNWKIGSTPSFTETNNGTRYIDTTYYPAPDSITLNVKYLDYFYIYCYDQDKNQITFLFADMGKTYDTSQYTYVRFAFPKKDEYTDYQTKIDLTMNYAEDYLSTLIRPQQFQYKDSTYINYIESANAAFDLYINNKQYTVNSSSFILDYDNDNDEFYLRPDKEFFIEITRIDGNYKLNVTETIKEGD